MRLAGSLLMAVFFLEAGPLALAAEIARPQATTGLLPGETPPAPVRSRQASPNKGLRNVEGPPRKFKLTPNPSLAEIQQTRVVSSEMRAVGVPAVADRAAVAQALIAYEASGGGFDPKGAAVLENYCRANPDSPFTPSLLQERATALQRNGCFGQALEAYGEAYRKVKDSAGPEAAAIRDSVLADYLRLLGTLGRKEELKVLLEELKTETLDYYAAAAYRDVREISGYLDSRAEQNIQCGFHAINNVFEQTPGFKPLFPHVHDPVEAEEFKKNGLSLFELKAHADESSHPMVIGKRQGAASVPVPAVFHWKFGHYSALTDFKDGKYRLVDSYLKFDGWISPEVLAEEGSGYFVFPGEKLAEEFSPVGDKEAKSVFGRHCTHSRNGEGAQPKKGGPPKRGCGMAGYTFQLLKAGLVIMDTPFDYTPTFGPKVSLNVSYSQYQDGPAITGQPFHISSGWNFEWSNYAYGSYSSAGNPPASLQIIYGDTDRFTYNWNAGLSKYVAASDPTATVQYSYVSSQHKVEVNYPDGSKRIFAQPNSASSTFSALMLSELYDPAGNKLTFQYDGSFRLIQITDATGGYTTLSYTPHAGDPSANTRLVRTITDPFGRVAKFHYNSSSKLIKIVDPLLIESEFTYDGGFIDSLKTPYGTTKFTMGNLPGLAASGNWLEAEGPDGRVERIETGDTAPVPETTANPPAASVNVGGVTVPFYSYNGHLHWRNSYYWDKNAWAKTPRSFANAIIYHWATDGASGTTSVPESIKKPGQEWIWFNYPGQGADNLGATTERGTMPKPSKIAQVVEGPSGTPVTQLQQFEYNALGNVTKYIDPLGRETVLEYAVNNVDLVKIKQKTGASTYDTVAEYLSYSNHLPQTVKDAAAQSTALAYNARGQITSVTNAKSEVTTFTYNGTTGFLESVDGPLSGTQDRTQFAPDSFRRIGSLTTPDSYVLSFNYDDFDRPTLVTYPDGSTTQFNYKWLDLEWKKDRMGRWQKSTYNSLQQLSSVRDALGRVTQYFWCGCGSLAKLVDPAGNTTQWLYDAQARLVRKTYADNTQVNYSYQPLSGRLAAVTDALGQVSTQSYFEDGSLKQIAYSSSVHATPNVSFTYETRYRRLAGMVDGGGATSYTYRAAGSDGAGQTETVDGPLADDTLTYGYDELGRLVNRRVNGTANETALTFDAAGRLSSLQNPLGTFTNTFVGGTGRIDTITYPNGQVTDFGYHSTTNDLRLQEIHNKFSGGANISKFNYAYDKEGNITDWGQISETANARNRVFDYDAANQVTGAGLFQTLPFPSLLQQDAYRYDLAGNRTVEQRGMNVVSASANNLNQLTGSQGGGLMRVRGTLNEPGTVTVASNGGAAQPAVLDGNNVFTGYVNVDPGSNTVTVNATDASPNHNVKTQSYQVTVTGGASRTFAYDLNGNMTDDGAGKVYAWDAANRLIKITYGNGEKTEFSYDGLGRRVRIVEKDASNVTVGDRRFVWDGLQIAEERDSSNAIAKKFYGQGVKIGGNGYFYTRDHLGSVRELTNAGNAVQSAYDYDSYGRQETALPSGMKIWLKADAGVTKDGSNKVSAWADQSGNGANSGQGTSGAQPTWVGNALNGLPALRFDGSDDHLTGTTNGYNPSAGDYTIFVTHKRSSPAFWSAPLTFNTAAMERGAPLVTWRDTTEQLGVNNAGNTDAGAYVDLSAAPNDYYVSTVQRGGGTNGNGGALTVRSFSAGDALQSRATQNWSSDATGGYVVGRHWSNQNYLNGDVAEVIVYNRNLTPAERTRVESYLAKKYARKEVQSDFRYTGHFYHEKSGLSLAPYRAYNADLGRWISRDPMGERSPDDPNAYAYVSNNPSNMVDPNGLWGVGWGDGQGGVSFNLGIGDPSALFTPDSAEVMGHAAQATVDGILPFSDPFADLGKISPQLNAYDPTTCGSRFSRGMGQVTFGLIALGAAVQFFAPEWANSSIGWKGGELTLTKPGAATPDFRFNPTGGSGYPPHYHRRPGIGKHRPWDGGW